MSRLDELPPDQRAALSILLRQRKSYTDVAAMLGITESAVHDRAHAALAVLAPRLARELTPDRRKEIGDYLLGQQTGVAERLKTRAYLNGSEPGQAWARAIAGELAPLSDSQLPEIPTGVTTAVSAGVSAGGEERAQGAQMPPIRAADVARSTQASKVSAASGASSTAASTTASSSRLGGALLLAVIVAAVVVAVVLIAGGGSSHDKTASATSKKSSTSTTGSPAVTQKLTLHSPSSKSNSVGVVEVLSEGGKRAFYIQAEHIPATKHFFYAIWLYNSHTSAKPLSKSPAVGKSHKLAGGALLPSDAGNYKEILLTRETSTHPTHPGHVVLRGPFSLGSS